MSFNQVTLSTDERHMHSQLHDDMYVDWEKPQPKIASNTPIAFPDIFVSSGGAVCMFTLGWNPWEINTKHSVPFPVDQERRKVGADEMGRPINDAWAFNSTFPRGVSLSGRRREPKNDTGSGSSSSNNWDDNDGNNDDPPVGEIVGAVLGGLSLIVIVAWLVRRFSRQSKGPVPEEDTGEMARAHDHGPVVSPHPETRSIDDLPPPTYQEATKV